jgi:hypothetical protein
LRPPPELTICEAKLVTMPLSATPPAPMDCTPPLETKVPLAMPPLATYCSPPPLTTVAPALPKSSCAPLLAIVAPVADPPEETI